MSGLVSVLDSALRSGLGTYSMLDEMGARKKRQEADEEERKWRREDRDLEKGERDRALKIREIQDAGLAAGRTPEEVQGDLKAAGYGLSAVKFSEDSRKRGLAEKKDKFDDMDLDRMIEELPDVINENASKRQLSRNALGGQHVGAIMDMMRRPNADQTVPRYLNHKSARWGLQGILGDYGEITGMSQGDDGSVTFKAGDKSYGPFTYEQLTTIRDRSQPAPKPEKLSPGEVLIQRRLDGSYVEVASNPDPDAAGGGGWSKDQRVALDSHLGFFKDALRLGDTQLTQLDAAQTARRQAVFKRATALTEAAMRGGQPISREAILTTAEREVDGQTKRDEKARELSAGGGKARAGLW